MTWFYRANVWRPTLVTRMKSIACSPTFPWRGANGLSRGVRTTWSTSGTCRPRRSSRSWPDTRTWCSPPPVTPLRTSLHLPAWKVTKLLSSGDQTLRNWILCLSIALIKKGWIIAFLVFPYMDPCYSSLKITNWAMYIKVYNKYMCIENWRRKSMVIVYYL